VVVARPARAVGLLLAAFAVQSAAGQSAQQIRDPNEQLLREQQERQRQELLRRAPMRIDQQSSTQAPETSANIAPQDIVETGPVFTIHDIQSQGPKLLSDAEFAKIVAPFEGQQLGVARINALLGRINRALIDAGYITSRAYVGAQNLAEGTLTVTLVAGRIEQLLYNGQPVSGESAGMVGVRWAMPMRQGDILRLQDIEQAVDQINRLRRNHAQVQIRPGTEPGGSIVDFSNKPTDGDQYSLTVDRNGPSSTGRLRVQGGWEQGNILGLMESLSLGLTTARDTNAVYGTFSVPLGYSTISALASYSEYQNLIGDIALVYGRSVNYTFSYGYLLARDQTSKTALDVALSRRSSNRWIDNLALTGQNQTVLRAGVNRLTRFQTKRGLGQWTIDAGIARGLPWLNAGRDLADLPPEAARFEFTRLELSGSWELPLPANLLWRSRIATQWTRNPLYSSEQIFAGGPSSVRGFAESAVGGDRGGYWRNEWAYKGQSVCGSAVPCEPYMFLDGARLTTLSDHRHHNMLGAGAGIRVAYAKTYVDAALGKPLRHPSDIPGGWLVNLSATYQF